MATTGPRRRGGEPRGDSYDTAGLDLLRHGFTLRRDAGQWRLSVPNGDGRAEFRIRTGGVDSAPGELARLLSGVALGEPVARVAMPAAEERRPADAVSRYLDAQVQAILRGDVWFRAGLDAVHSTRVGIRRLRSVLRVFAPLLDPAQAPRLDDELRWYAGLLGDVRDRQVLRRRFATTLAGLPAGLVLGPVADTIERDLLSEQLRRWEDARRALDGERYRSLLVALSRTAIPSLVVGDARDRDAIARCARRAADKADRRLAAARADDEASASALHRARKAAKRARYAHELAAPVIGGKPARRRIARFAAAQRVLGEHHDSVIAAEALLALGSRAGAGGENGFTLGLLYGLESQRARRARAEAARLAV